MNFPKVLILSISVFFSFNSHANDSIQDQIKILDQKYLVCNNVFSNTGSVSGYKKCLEFNYKEYDNTIKTIRSLKGFNQKSKWDNFTQNISAHTELCLEGAKKSPSRFIHKEISLCNHFMYKSLALTALNLTGN